MAHHQLAFQLTHRLQSYTAHNDDGCTAQGDAHAAVVTAGLQGRNRRLTNQGVHDGEQGNLQSIKEPIKVRRDRTRMM